jgi:electron transfer flavoprotein alpha subunit
MKERAISSMDLFLIGVGPRAQIVAVNKYAEAPIFGLANSGAVADAQQLLPLLADLIEERRKELR